MATLKASVKWYGDKVKKLVSRQGQKGVEEIAFAVRDKARKNLVANGQIDTKFLYNSIYVATPDKHSPIHSSGTYRSLKGNGLVRRENANIVQPAKGAFVGAAANYAVYPELQQPYLFPALEEVAGREAEGLLTGLYIDD